MAWNARGLVGELLDVERVLKEKDVSMAVFMETGVTRERVDNGLGAECEYRWVTREEWPLGGRDGYPLRQLGALCHKVRLPGAECVREDVFSIWIKVPARVRDERDLYVCIVHMPQGGEVVDRKFALDEIRRGLDRYRVDGTCAVVGDFNARCGCNGDGEVNTPGRVLMDFADEQALTIVNCLDSLCSGSFSRVQTVHRDGAKVVDRTTVDYVLVDDCVLDSVRSLSIIEDAGLNSDHRPLLVEASWRSGKVVAAVPRQHQCLEPRIRAPSVANAPGFEEVCEKEMVKVCAEHVIDPLGDAEVLQRQLDDKVESLTGALKRAAGDHFGLKLVGRQAKGWFDKEVRELYKLKLLARAVRDRARNWDQALATEAQELMDRAASRQRAVSTHKIASREMEWCLGLERAQKDSKSFYALWRRRVRELHPASRITEVYDTDGATVSEPLEVLRVWRDYCEGLCADRPIDSSDRDEKGDASAFDDRFAQMLAQEMKLKMCVDGVVPELRETISWEEVHCAIRGLPSGKAAGPDGICGDLLKIAGVGFEDTLARIFNEIWSTLTWPKAWCLANMYPLHKAGDILNPDNSRLLAVESAMPKVFERVLDSRIRAWSERVGALSDLQGGFRSRRATLDQVFTLKEIAAERRESRQETLLCFVDVSKAYDTVWRPGLWFKLKSLGLDSHVLELVMLMFHTVSRRVIISGVVSGEFESCLGVPQGSVLSPLLYANYINGLHAVLRRSGCGVSVADELVPLLFYADDIVLIAGSISAMKRSIAAMERYARRWRFTFNAAKSNLVVIGTRCFKLAVDLTQWSLGRLPLVVVDCYRYLGIEFTDRLGQGSWEHYIRRIVSRTRSAQALLMFQAGGANGLRPSTVVGQWKAQCRPRLEYACQLWQGGISRTLVDLLEATQSEFHRAVLAMKDNPAACGVRSDLGSDALIGRRQWLQLGYWRKLCTEPIDRVLTKVFHRRHAQVLAGGARLSTLRNFCATLTELDLGWYWQRRVAGRLESSWRALSRARCDLAERRRWQAEVSVKRSLVLYRALDHKPELGVAPYLADHRSNMWGTRLMSRLRLGTLWTMSRLHSVSGGVVSDECLLCHTAPETSTHFVCECPALALARADFLRVLRHRLPLARLPGRELLRMMELGFRDKSGWQQIVGCVAGFLVPAERRAKEAWSRQSAFVADWSPVVAVDDSLAQARWLLSAASKNFLVRCWQLRTDQLGTLRWESGRLVSTPPVPRGRPRLRAVLAPTVGFVDRAKWEPFRDRVADPVTPRKARRNRNFYVVWNGRVNGVMYRYCDVLDSMRGYPGASCKGYDTLQEAYKHV